MQTSVFGQANDTDVHEVILRSNSGMEAKILTWGAAIRDLLIPTKQGQQRVVVGFNSLDDYLSDNSHAGTIAGRFANRINKGCFEIDGKSYQSPLNQDGKHTLHGGHDGQAFSRRLWKLKAHDETSVTLTLDSPDGEAGYPGNLQVECIYRLLEPATIQVELTATTDAPTLCNLVSHSYFNLEMPAGFSNAPVPSATGHAFLAASDFYTPVDSDCVPTGEVRATAGTPFDFRKVRLLRNPENVKYDSGFVLREQPKTLSSIIHAGSLIGPTTQMAMDVFTNEPHLQLYDGGSYAGPATGLDGAQYGQHCGVCLEPQRYPDSPNHRHFSNAILRPEETYRQVTEYRFRTASADELSFS